MRPLEEHEGILLTEVGNDFWCGLGKLVADCLRKVPEDLHDHMLEHMQEAASVYGSNYERYLSDANAAVPDHRAQMKAAIAKALADYGLGLKPDGEPFKMENVPQNTGISPALALGKMLRSMIDE
jgi:hypothetical protein